MSYDKAKLAELFKAICENTISGPIDYTKHQRFRIIGGAGSAILLESPDKQFFGRMPEQGTPTLHVVDHGYEAFDTFVDEVMLDVEMASLVGRNAISETLIQVLQETGGVFPADEDDPARFIRMKVLKPLRDAIQTWDVYVPIVNLRLYDTLQIGAVQFAIYEGGLPHGELVSGKCDDSNRASSPDKVPELPPRMAEILGKYECWASTTLQSHPRNLSLVARRKVGHAINALRAFTPLLFSRDNKHLFGMAGLVGHGTFVVLGRDEGKRLIMRAEAVGCCLSFDLTKEALEFLRANKEFGRLSDIIGKEDGDLTNFQQRIAVASDWIGRAAAADTIEDEYVKATIGLERLLICEDEETTTESIAMRLAHLIGEQPDEKGLIHRSAKRLYDIRSKIVHQGFIGVSKDEMQEMSTFVIEALVACLRLTETVTSHEELRKLLKKRSLS
jgi:hypothetical protein